MFNQSTVKKDYTNYRWEHIPVFSDDEYDNNQYDNNQ